MGSRIRFTPEFAQGFAVFAVALAIGWIAWKLTDPKQRMARAEAEFSNLTSTIQLLLSNTDVCTHALREQMMATEGSEARIGQIRKGAVFKDWIVLSLNGKPSGEKRLDIQLEAAFQHPWPRINRKSFSVTVDVEQDSERRIMRCLKQSELAT